MDLSKNNTSLKKYFGIIKTKSTDTTFYSPPAKANEGLWILAAGARAPPRVGVTVSNYSYAEIKMQALKEGRKEIPRCHSAWRRVSLVPPELFSLSFLLLSIVPLGARGGRCGRVTEDGACVLVWFLSPAIKKSGANVLCWRIRGYRTKNT